MPLSSDIDGITTTNGTKRGTFQPSSPGRADRDCSADYAKLGKDRVRAVHGSLDRLPASPGDGHVRSGDDAQNPMRVRDIHLAAEALAGRSLRWGTVNSALSAYTIGGDRRFRRVGYGRYEICDRTNTDSPIE